MIRGAGDGIVLLLDFDATRNLANLVLVGKSNDGTGSSSTLLLDVRVAVKSSVTKESLDRFIVIVDFLCLVELGVEGSCFSPRLNVGGGYRSEASGVV